MIYERAVQRVASPSSILPDVALLRRKWGEESSPEQCGSSTHAESVCRGASISQRSRHE